MMTTTRLFPHTLLLALFAAGARAEAPFVVNGLHLDMVFSDALVWAQQRGGECRVRDSRSQVGGKRADCRFPACTEDAPGAGGETAGDCASPAGDYARLIWVGFEAPTEADAVSRAVLQFSDDPAVVGAALRTAYGAPRTDTSGHKEKSWSHSTRLGWSSGDYTMGLLNAEKYIILAQMPAQKKP